MGDDDLWGLKDDPVKVITLVFQCILFLWWFSSVSGISPFTIIPGGNSTIANQFGTGSGSTVTGGAFRSALPILSVLAIIAVPMGLVGLFEEVKGNATLGSIGPIPDF